MLRTIAITFLVFGAITPFRLEAQPTDCSDGIVHDDGSFENGVGSSSVFFTHTVMRIDPPATPAVLDSVCVCWSQVSLDTRIDFEITVWDSDGPDGAPGTFLGTLSGVTATGVPFGVGGEFYRYDMSSIGITLNGPIYIGPTWDSFFEEDFFVCVDENGPSTQPGYFDAGVLAGLVPPVAQLGTAGLFPTYRNLGVRAVTAEISGTSLDSVSGLIVPGFEVEVDDPTGPNTLFAVRNITNDPLAVNISYFGSQVGDMPLRNDVATLGAQATRTVNVRSNLAGLSVTDGFATGLAIVTEVGGTTAPHQVGDYFRVDDSNDFATGNRLVQPSSFCEYRETRLVNFGSGSEFRILANLPPTNGAPAFSFTVYNEAGVMQLEGDLTTENHLTVVDASDLGITNSFGTILFDFSSSSGGWVSSRYSAFNQFSAEIVSECRTDLPGAFYRSALRSRVDERLLMKRGEDDHSTSHDALRARLGQAGGE